MACLTLPGLWLQQELERTSSHWISTDLHPLLSLNRSTHTPPPLTPSHSQAHIAKQLASKREAGEGYLFLASSLRGPQGAGNLLASSDQPSEQALPLHAHPGSQTTLPAQRLQDALLLSCLGFSWLGPPYPHPLSSQWQKGMQLLEQRELQLCFPGTAFPGHSGWCHTNSSWLPPTSCPPSSILRGLQRYRNFSVRIESVS